jgi:protein-disulfide isomerase
MAAERQTWTRKGVAMLDRTAERPAAALAATDHSLGSLHADLTLLEYGDYASLPCARVEPVLRHLVDSHGHLVRFVYRHFPLLERHPQAELAAEAAEAAAAQGQFWPMHHLICAHPLHLELTALTEHARTIGLDMTRFMAEMADRVYTQRVHEHRRAGARAGVLATPALFLDGIAIDLSFGLRALGAAVRRATQQHSAR